MFDAGEVRASLGADFRPGGFAAFDAAMKRSGKNVDGFEGQLARATARSRHALRSLGTVAGVGTAGAFVALGLGVAKSVKAYADYNRQMQTVQAVSKASAAQMKTLDAETKKIGTTTKYSATQAAAGAVELVKAGMSMKQVVGGGLRTALSLAAAGDLELADASKYVADAMNLFGIEAKGSTQIADGLAKAAQDTTADVGDFGMALTQGGSAAKTAGLTFQDTMVILEGLAKAGIKNSDAGTSMKSALIQLIKPTEKQAELQKELGLNFVGANGKMKDGVQIAKMLRTSTHGMKDAQRAAAFATLAGTDGMRVLNSLYAAGPQLLGQYEKGISATGTAAETAAARQKGLAGATDRAKGSFSTALVVIGEKLAPTITKLATGFSDAIARMAANGQLAHFGDQLANGLTQAVYAGQGLISVLQGMISAGAPLGQVLQVAFSALSMIPSQATGGALMGVVSALLAMRVAAAVAPMLSAVATGIKLVAMAARTGELMAMPGLLMASATPLGMLAVGSAAAGAGIALLATRQTDAERAARASAAAQRDLAASLRELDGAEDDAAGKIMNEKDAKLGVGEARARAKATRGTQEHARAVLELERAQMRLNEATEASSDSQDNLRKTQRDTEVEGQKRVGAALKELNVAKELAQTKLIGAGRGARSVGPSPEALANVANKQRAYNEAIAKTSVAWARAGLAQVNAQRMAAGGQRIAAPNVSGVSSLMRAMHGMPRQVQTKILMNGDQKVLSQLGKVSASLYGILPQKRIQAILSGDGTLKQKLAHLRAIARRNDDKVIRAILQGGGTAQQQLQTLRSLKIPNKQFTVQAVKLGPFSFDVVVTKTTREVKGKARGGGANDGGLALVGEGSNPREAVISRKTGDGYFTTGPLLTNLSDDDYVIPTDTQFRGRASGLFMQLAQDLGVPMHKRGKKPSKTTKAKDFPIPPKYQQAALAQPLDAMQSDMDTAKSKVESTKKQKGKKYDKASHERWVARYKKRKKDFQEAKKFANAIAEQEDLVEIAENDMTIASKQKNSGGYESAKGARRAALAKLQDWFRGALDVAPADSAWARELQKKLGEKSIAALGGDDEKGADGNYLTGAEQSRIDDLDAQLALAEVNTPDDITDDKNALTAIQQLREQILGRVKAAGAPSTVIADAARAVKAARDAASSISPSISSDQQAQLDQTTARLAAAEKDRDTNANALAVFKGAGDIGAGGQIAYAAAGGPVININTLTPSDPATLKHVAGAMTAGVAAQGYIPRSRVRTGV